MLPTPLTVKSFHVFFCKPEMVRSCCPIKQRRLRLIFQNLVYNHFHRDAYFMCSLRYRINVLSPAAINMKLPVFTSTIYCKLHIKMVHKMHRERSLYSANIDPSIISHQRVVLYVYLSSIEFLVIANSKVECNYNPQSARRQLSCLTASLKSSTFVDLSNYNVMPMQKKENLILFLVSDRNLTLRAH
jgi:hypothetical protein